MRLRRSCWTLAALSISWSVAVGAAAEKFWEKSMLMAFSASCCWERFNCCCPPPRDIRCNDVARSSWREVEVSGVLPAPTDEYLAKAGWLLLGGGEQGLSKPAPPKAVMLENVSRPRPPMREWNIEPCWPESSRPDCAAACDSKRLCWRLPMSSWPPRGLGGGCWPGRPKGFIEAARKDTFTALTEFLFRAWFSSTSRTALRIAWPTLEESERQSEELVDFK